MPEPQAHQALMEEIARLEDLAREWIELFPQAAVQGQHWQKVLSQVQAHAAEDTCRLAVVGAVKSGKSTMINALVGQDLLRRGAGILTAMVTRVQPGPEAQAVLRFKGWDEINGEIRRALGLLPNPRLVDRAAPLDLQAPPDRELLAQVLAEAREADLWTGGSLDQNYLLLKSYLEGYDLLLNLMPASGTLPLTGPDLARHRDLVTREATAVYLKDVLLTIPFPWPATGLELGDCQGSDSPFPQHLAQVLAYLIKSDLALYVVSSRVGLRQADFQFLSELKRMGLIPHILVLLNLDLGEHTSYAEVVKIRDRVAQELGSWQAEPRVYAFSALKLLLTRRLARGESLDPREAATLKVWALDPDSAAFAEAEAARFEDDLKTILGNLKTRRLAGGSLAQVRMVARGLREQLELTQDLLTRGLTAIQELETRLEARRQPLHATMATVSQTLEGAGHRLKKTLRSRVDTLLDRHSGRVGKDLSEFIGNFTPDWDQLAPPSVTPAFRPVLYKLFQEFAQALAQHVTNEANLTLVEFIREQEEWLRQELARLWQPLFLTLQEALSLYYREIADLGLAASAPSLEATAVARPQGLEVPLLNLEVAPDWRFAREVWVASGMGVLGRARDAIKRRLKLAGEVDPRQQLLRDLERALAALKAWLGSELEGQLLNYREGLKFQFFFPLVDQWLKLQEAGLEDTLGSLLGGLSGAAEAMHLAEAERAERRRRLDQLIPLARRIEARLEAGEPKS
ncbi:MAG: dynamin family protein [Deltaproteobacteria bacterium]|nr:dynamin family protein [Deltaproteobacteria bacterium]